MAAYVKLLGFVAKVEDGQWTSPDANLTDLLNQEEQDPRNHPDASHPHPDHARAERAALAHHGSVLKVDAAPETVEGRVY